MAGNSLESLLAWMKDSSRMAGWDLIIALDGRTINRGLYQDYMIRLSQGNDLGALDLVIGVPDTDIVHQLSNLILSVPEMSFAEASLQSTKADFIMRVIGGTLLTLKSETGQREIIKLASFDPLGGEQLQLSSSIDKDSKIIQLDLEKSQDIELSLFETSSEQEQVGMGFLKAIGELISEKRVFPLGTFPDQSNPFMLTDSVDVRTHKRRTQTSALAPQAVDEDGALLIFTSMAQGRKGDFPADHSDFRYLIPDDDGQKTWSGTALFSQSLIHRAAFGDAVLRAFENVMFEPVTDGTGMLTKLVAKIGDLQIKAGSYKNQNHEFESEIFNVPSTGGTLPLTVEFDESQATQHWSTQFPMSFRYRPIGGTSWQSHTATFSLRLEHEFHFSADDSSPLGLEGELFVPYTHTQEVTHESGLPDTITPVLMEQIKDFIANTVKRGILERFSNTLTATVSKEFLPQFDLIGQNNLQTTDVALPCDLAMFGQVQPAGSSYSIVQPQLIIGAGKTLQLSTEPTREGLQWSVENLPGSASDPGTINDQGAYRAPPRHGLQGKFNRVLIIASDPETNERSVAMVTVQSSSITVNPLIQRCFPGDRIKLSANHIDGNRLDWSIKNPVPGESGTLVVSEQGEQIYIAGPQVPGKTYVLDEIEVKDSQSDETVSAWVLAVQHSPGALIKIVNNPSLPEGQIQLQAIVNGNPIAGIWSLPTGGSGDIDSSGLYTDDPLAKDSFVLVNVTIDGGEWGVFEGHIILPRPLTDFPAVFKALTE